MLLYNHEYMPSEHVVVRYVWSFTIHCGPAPALKTGGLAPSQDKIIVQTLCARYIALNMCWHKSIVSVWNLLDRACSFSKYLCGVIDLF